jgi:N6-L-threonylcarbamoyladenine synthase
MTETRYIMAFESSADETSVAIVKNGVEIISLATATQIKSHQRFGGIVPEVASRHHIEQVTILADAALADAKLTYQDLTAIGVTRPRFSGRFVNRCNSSQNNCLGA